MNACWCVIRQWRRGGFRRRRTGEFLDQRIKQPLGLIQAASGKQVPRFEQLLLFALFGRIVEMAWNAQFRSPRRLLTDVTKWYRPLRTLAMPKPSLRFEEATVYYYPPRRRSSLV